MRLFVDMDGTVVEWKAASTVFDLYKEGYFLNLSPQDSMIDAVNRIQKDEDISVYILSCYLADSPYALEEKAMWLERHLPTIPAENYVFVPCGRKKSDYVPGGIQASDILLDDYTQNLLDWDGVGIKCLNGINHRHKTWKGHCVDIYSDNINEDLRNIFSEIQRSQSECI